MTRPGNVRYICVAPTHATGVLTEGCFTIEHGMWGYCASTEQLDGHQWREVSNVLHGSAIEMGNYIRGMLEAAQHDAGFVSKTGAD